MTAKNYLEHLLSQLDKMERGMLGSEDTTMLLTVLEFHKLSDIK